MIKGLENGAYNKMLGNFCYLGWREKNDQGTLGLLFQYLCASGPGDAGQLVSSSVEDVRVWSSKG